jgi:hypothetical protein
MYATRNKQLFCFLFHLCAFAPLREILLLVPESFHSFSRPRYFSSPRGEVNKSDCSISFRLRELRPPFEA